MAAIERDARSGRHVKIAALVAGVLITVGLAAARSIAAPSDPAPKDFTLSGDVDGLYPGVPSELSIRIDNPQNVDLVVTKLTVTAGDADATCRGGNLTIGNPKLPIVVRKKGQAVATVNATLAPGAPDSCQGALFPLTYVGTASRK